MRRWIMLSLAAVACACRSGAQADYLCETTYQCDLRTGGLCVPAADYGQACAYPDGACESGYAYDDSGTLTGTCVPVETEIVDAEPQPDAPIDAALHDAPDAFDPTMQPDAPIADAPVGQPLPCRVTYSVGPAGHRDLYVSDFDGANPHELSGGMGEDNIDGQWSPRADSIVFASKRETYDLILVGVDGRQPRNLTSALDASEGAVDDKLPRWSPDGQRIAWFRSPQSLYLMNADGSSARRVDILRPTSITWSPDSRFLMFVGTTASGNTEIYILPVSGGSLAQAITNTPHDSEHDVTWSPDGSLIAFTRSYGSTSDIWISEPDGRNPRNLTPDTPNTIDVRPVWAPDGRSILFTSNRDGSSTVAQTWRRHRVFRVSVSGGTPTRLTDHGPEGYLNAGDWLHAVAPDGSRALFTRHVSSTVVTVGTVTLGGEDVFLFPPGANEATGFAWSPCD